MSRRRLRNKEIRTLAEALPVSFDKNAVIEQDDKGVLVNGEYWFFLYEGVFVPSLRLLQQQSLLPEVTVDMGAVSFVVRGADIMRPGITDVQDVDKDGFVVVVDQNHRKPLAVGRALVSGDDMRAASTGRMIQTIHYVGDELWNS